MWFPFFIAAMASLLVGVALPEEWHAMELFGQISVGFGFLMMLMMILECIRK